jgi:RsmE family RNA methyltransferase
MKVELLVTVLVLVMFHHVTAWNSSLRLLLHHDRTASAAHRSSFHSSVVCRLNRFLFDESEVNHDNEQELSVTLSKDDYRTVHAAKILSLHNGDTVRCGIVGCAEHEGLISDEATVQWLPEGKVKKSEPLGNGDPPGSLRITLKALQTPDELMEKPSVSLILALPRPLQLGRMLPMISQMGVDTLVLTEARKVPKDYFGSHLFRKPELLTERLIEGLCQAGDVRLPKVHVVRHLSNFLNNELDELFPTNECARVIAHPQRSSVATKATRIRHVHFPAGAKRRCMVVAVGPEGGWEEPEELDRFTRVHSFQQVTMGSRVLRSDCAVVSLLGLAQDACDAET